MADPLRVICLFDRSGIMGDPWAAAGHHVLCIDKYEPRHKHGNIQIDIRQISPDNFRYDVLLAFPPCTDLAGSGARWWAAKGPEALQSAMELVDIAREWASKATMNWLIENPVGRLSTYWRPPDWTFDPWEYAGWADNPEEEAYTKRTCIWTNMTRPVRKSVPPVMGSKMHLLPPGPERQYLRSLTPQGFARAVYDHLSKPQPEQMQLWKIKNI
tara:strand:- start:248 stop:889 length:642 start_codon:yes stop_codon:yes gene_type:complete